MQPAAALAADSLVAAAVAKIIFLLASHVFTALFAHCSNSAGSNCFWLPAANGQQPASSRRSRFSVVAAVFLATAALAPVQQVVL